MLYHKVNFLKAERFRRLTGVRRGTFRKIVAILTAAQEARHWHGGRKSKLCIEDITLMALMYLRENRTYFHIAQTYGLFDSACWTTIRWVEDTLIKSRVFRLPGKKALLTDGAEFEVVMIDAAETPIERPKKTAPALFRKEKAPHVEVAGRC